MRLRKKIRLAIHEFHDRRRYDPHGRHERNHRQRRHVTPSFRLSDASRIDMTPPHESFLPHRTGNEVARAAGAGGAMDVRTRNGAGHAEARRRGIEAVPGHRQPRTTTLPDAV